MLNRQAFDDVLADLQAQVEKRRRRYLLFFYINSVLACMLVVASVMYGGTILAALAHAMGRTNEISNAEFFSLQFFTVVCAASLVLLPVLRYQGSLKPEFALHRRVWQHLCDALGDAELMPRGAEFQHQLRASGLFNEFGGIAERAGIKGRAGSYQFWVQEMAIVNEEGQAPLCSVVVLARNDHRLHGDESRRNYSASITDHDWVLQGEATAFRPFVMLAERAPVARQVLYWDHRLLHGIQSLRDKLHDWFTDRQTRPALAVELAYEAQFLKAPHILHAFRDAAQGKQIPALRLSLQGNNYVAALHSALPLFINFSLFEPAFPAEKANFVYELVQSIGAVSSHSHIKTVA